VHPNPTICHYRVIQIADNDIIRAKVILLGDEAVGKTSLVQSYIYNKFENSYKKTLGVDFLNHSLDIDGQIVDLIIWDIAGEAKFASFKKFYLSNAHGALFVFDSTRRETLTGLSEWVSDFEKYSPNTINIICSNKVDLPEKEVYIDETRAYAEIYKAVDSIETSAKTGKGVAEAFTKIARRILESHKIS